MVSIHVDINSQNDSKHGRGSSESRRIRRTEPIRNKRKEKVKQVTNYQSSKKPAWTLTKQFANYITMRGIELATSWKEQDWPKQCAKELMNNAYDSLNDYYPNGTIKTRKIALQLKVDSIMDGAERRILLRILVRNSNVDDIAVFEKLEPIFDFTQHYSTKRHQHRIMTGALGDFLKRVLGMGYASWTGSHNEESSFEDKQWKEPLILRYNGQEHRVLIVVDGDIPNCFFSEPTSCNATNFTEVEIALPIASTLDVSWKEYVESVLSQIKEYFKRNKIGKTNTDFSFSENWSSS